VKKADGSRAVGTTLGKASAAFAPVKAGKTYLAIHPGMPANRQADIVRDVAPRLYGRCAVVRFADDIVMIFGREHDARRVLHVLPARFGKYGLTLHPDKTRLIPFRRPDFAAQRRDSMPGTFDLLGFTHHWALSNGEEFDGEKARVEFSKPGTFTATLTTTDPHGLACGVATDTVNITTKLRPASIQLSD